MKRWYFVIVLMLSVVAIVGFGMYFVNQANNQLTENLDEIEIAVKNNDIEKAILLCEKAEKDWIKNEKKLTYFVNHSDICEIGVCISSIESFIKCNEQGEYLSELNKLRVMITHLCTMEFVKK